MDKHRKLLNYILMKKGDANVPFMELCKLLCHMGFIERIKGDHHIFTLNTIEEIINIQPLGSKAKSYQVKQIRDIILRYGLKGKE